MQEAIEQIKKEMLEENDDYAEGYNDGLLVALRILEQHREG